MARKSLGEILYNGKRYLSLNLAASQCGYHKEYLRQLIRAGKLDGERIKDLWFIEEEIFARFRKENKFYGYNNTNSQSSGLLQEIQNIKNELAEVKSTVLTQQTSNKLDPWDRALLEGERNNPFKSAVVKSLSVVLIIFASVFFTKNFDRATAGVLLAGRQVQLAAASLQETAVGTAADIRETALNLQNQVRSLSLSLSLSANKPASSADRLISSVNKSLNS